MTEPNIEYAGAPIDWPKVILGLLALGVVSVALYMGLRYLLEHRREAAPAPATAVAPQSPSQGEMRPGSSEAATKTNEATPALPMSPEEGDDALGAEIARLSGTRALPVWLVPKYLIHDIVATVDALPRRQVPLQVRPVLPVPGHFMVSEEAGQRLISSGNSARYAPYVRFLGSIHPAAAAATYHRFYPLFQDAYRSLGYPGKSFNDRLLEAIDDALLAPDPSGPLRVVAPSVMWKYSDPDLESLSGGQKILLRMGQSNSRAVRKWLTEFRAAIG
jgi:DUF3014 family protein